MILPAVLAKVENGVHLNMVAAGAPHHRLLAQSMTKLLARPKAAVGALQLEAAPDGAL